MYALVYAICGESFEPDKDKINAKAGVVTISDEDSCSKMASHSDTKGNMYLLKDGACVQSFKFADFDAELAAGDDGKMK